MLGKPVGTEQLASDWADEGFLCSVGCACE
jgi:hypothetical protein